MKQEKINILSVDSSSRVGCVALCCDEELIAQSSVNLNVTHSQTLLTQIHSLLTTAGWQPQDLDLLAVVSGPGAFTGLRVGLATIKGLAQVLDRPVVPITSLMGVALNLPMQTRPVCVFLDARKKEVYSQMFDCSTGIPVATGAPRVAPPRTVLEEIPADAVLIGDGVAVYRSLIDDIVGEGALLAPSCAHQLQSVRVAWLALQQYRSGAFEGAENIVPFYIRPADAAMPAKVRQ